VFGTVLPRVGFSWLPRPDTTLRGGFGVYAYNWSLDTYGAGMGAEVSSSGNVSDTTGGITPIVLLGGSGANLPYTPASTDPAAYNGQGVNFNQYHTPIPKIYQWNLAVQRQLGADFVAELAYVASHGFNLAFPVDINQVPEGSLSANDTAAKPYPQFVNIFGNAGTNNAISNYNSLQASIQKRFTSGLGFQFNYVWSHMLDEQDSSGWGSRAGDQYYQNSYKPQANYGASNFDVRNAFKGGLVYELPVGRGKHFSMNNNRILDEILGGWQASTTIVLSSGNPFTVIMQDVSNSQAQNFQQFPNRTGISTRPANRSIFHWYNPAAFSLPANYTFGNERRNSVYGPGFNRVNLSAGKIFSITEQVKLQIRADANNVFNHPSFYPPNQFVQVGSSQQVGQPFDIDAAGSQQINNTVGGPRTMQLGARLSF
jgi:hypothetical protein